MDARQSRTWISIAETFRALRHRNFRLFFTGQLLSLVGTWMQIVASSWLVYRLTNSPFLLGCVAFASQIPSFLLSPYAGVVADRHDRRRMLLVIQVLSLAQAVILSYLVLTGAITVWHILILGIFLGCVTAFDLPVRQAFISEMVEDRKDMNNAIALNSALFNASRLIGPAVAGVVIALFGEGVCFAINALSFIPIIIALMMMRVSSRRRDGKLRHALTEMKEGMRYVAQSIPIRTLLLLLAAVSFLAGGLQTLLPIFVREIYHGGSRAFGFVTSMSGVGALLGSLYLAGRRTVLGLGRMVGWATVGFGTGLVLFGIVNNTYVAGVVAFFLGLAMILAIGSTNMVLQTVVEEDKRGRVMSLYGAALVGLTPVGSIIAGASAGQVGLEQTVLAGGLVCLVTAVVYWRHYPSFRTQLRAVYVKKGILTEA
ncbi:MAG: MFS transporter [Candidatus Omnitrophica bacterium]|nr:MFS transporter [Candidatus Omnitrophota bacterium]